MKMTTSLFSSREASLWFLEYQSLLEYQCDLPGLVLFCLFALLEIDLRCRAP